MYSVVLLVGLSAAPSTPAGYSQAAMPQAGCAGSTTVRPPATFTVAPQATGCSGGTAGALGLRGRFVTRRSTGPLRRIAAAIFPNRAPAVWNPNVEIVASDAPQPTEASYAGDALATIITGYRQVCVNGTCHLEPVTESYVRMPQPR